jgi:PhoPQ-activated pathogenicity-related protein
MPKFVINSAGDQYFLPDSSKFYFGALSGEKYLRYVPNTDHSLKGSDGRESILAFYNSMIADEPRPKFSWSFAPGGAIEVKTATRPLSAVLWQVANPTARDFRLETIGPACRRSSLSANPDGTYTARVPEPACGWIAYFVELTFPSRGRFPFKFTTEVRVAPERLPFGPPPELVSARREAAPVSE